MFRPGRVCSPRADGANSALAMDSSQRPHRSFVASIKFVDRPAPPEERKKPLIIPYPELMPPHIRMTGSNRALRKELDEVNNDKATKAMRRNFARSLPKSRSERANMAEIKMDTPPPPPPPAPLPAPPPRDRCVSGLALWNAANSRRNSYVAEQRWWAVYA